MPDPEACAAGGGDLGDELCEVADRGRPTRRTASAPGAVGEGASATADGLRGHARAPPALACRATTRRPRGRPCAASSAWRCATRARPEGLLARLGGVPPGRPGHYLGWFLWDEQTRRSDADRADTLSGQAATGGYDNTRLALAREPRPSGPTGRISWPCQRWSNHSQSAYTPLPPRLSTTVQQCTLMPQNGSERPF